MKKVFLVTFIFIPFLLLITTATFMGLGSRKTGIAAAEVIGRELRAGEELLHEYKTEQSLIGEFALTDQQLEIRTVRGTVQIPPSTEAVPTAKEFLTAAYDYRLKAVLHPHYLPTALKYISAHVDMRRVTGVVELPVTAGFQGTAVIFEGLKQWKYLFIVTDAALSEDRHSQQVYLAIKKDSYPSLATVEQFLR